ncbi:MAG: hypothetical protein M3295_01720 [Chloroflexota bacterium]|nr:hypothetical protein [Chloroflexota bacterium]
MIGKVEKAMRYAHEPDRVKMRRLELDFQGDNGAHRVELDADTWRCTCHLFESWGSCVHTLAVQKMLGPMLTDKAQETTLYSAAAGVPTAV